MDNNPADPSSHNAEEEYQFAEESTSNKYEATASTATIARDEGKTSVKKRLLILLGVIIGAFCLYKLYGLFTAAPSKMAGTSVTHSTVSSTPSSKPLTAPAASVPIKTASQAEEIEGKTTKNKESLQNQISTLEQNMTQTSQTQENLQTQIGGLSAAITDIQNNVALLTQQISTFTQQKKESDVQVKPSEKTDKKITHTAVSIKTSPSKSNFMKRKTAYAQPMMYYVKALIQGRAWLIDSHGATHTVSTEDQLPGYGKILSINPDKGVVITSSGRIISFMVQDR